MGQLGPHGSPRCALVVRLPLPSRWWIFFSSHLFLFPSLPLSFSSSSLSWVPLTSSCPLNSAIPVVMQPPSTPIDLYTFSYAPLPAAESSQQQAGNPSAFRTMKYNLVCGDLPRSPPRGAPIFTFSTPYPSKARRMCPHSTGPGGHTGVQFIAPWYGLIIRHVLRVAGVPASAV